MIEAIDSNAKIYEIKIEMIPEIQIVSKTTDKKTEIKPGTKVRIGYISEDRKNSDYYLVGIIYLLQT